MSKEVRKVGNVPEALQEALAALPDPGLGKRLIVVIRASSVRLHVVADESTIKERIGEGGGGVSETPA